MKGGKKCRPTCLVLIVTFNNPFLRCDFEFLTSSVDAKKFATDNSRLRLAGLDLTSRVVSDQS
jgi:hypothetical protein